MELTGLPESMLVIGGNAVGLELAQMFVRLGTRVTIAEALDRLAPFDEPEVSAAIEDVFDGEGIGILTAATVMSVRGDAAARSVTITAAGEAERELACAQILVAAGRRPVTAGLNLDAAGVNTGGRGEILTNEYQQTANPRIWAAGDVTGGPQFVYTAAAADGAEEMITAASYAIRARMTVTDLAEGWAPYLTMSEGLRLVAQAFTRDVSRLSCCAA